jgi:hypothetical protein
VSAPMDLSNNRSTKGGSKQDFKYWSMAYSYHLDKDQKFHGSNEILEDVHTKLEDIHRKRLRNYCTITCHDRQREEFSLGQATTMGV